MGLVAWGVMGAPHTIGGYQWLIVSFSIPSPIMVPAPSRRSPASASVEATRRSSSAPVSYTHLDVYKRQLYGRFDKK